MAPRPESLFPILLYSKKRKIIKLLTISKYLNNKYLWKLLYTRKYKKQITKNYYMLYSLYNVLYIEYNDYCKYKQLLSYQTTNLLHIKDIFLSNDSLKNIHNDLAKMIYFQVITLNDFNKLKTISSEIGLLINLQGITTQFNCLLTLPKEIGNLINLQKIVLPCNNLYEIPSEIGNLLNLKIIKLHYNKIQFMPSEIGLLNSLEILWLQNNNIKSLPTELEKLVKLQEFILHDNKLT